MAKLKAVVLYDYDPEVADELKLKVGDVLTNIKKIEDGWCQGVLNGKSGMFPDNFVKLEEDKTPPPKPPSTKRKGTESKRYMKATYAYEPQNADELELKMDDIVEIIKDEEEGWALGALNGRKGVFPTNFCTPHTVAAEPASDKNKESEQHDPVQQSVPPKKIQGVGFGNIFGDGPIKLKKAAAADNKAAKPVDDKPANKTTHVEKPASKPAHAEKPPAKLPHPDKPSPKPAADDKPTPKYSQNEKPSKRHSPEGKTPQKVPSAREKSEKAAQLPGKKTKPVEKCRVTFDYAAATEDELNLTANEIITIITTECDDAGWWEGEKTDKDGKKLRGFFPDNFVTMLTPEELETIENSVKEATEHTTDETKPKVVVHEETDQNENKETSTTVTSTPSLKKPAPQIPSANLKPEPEDAAASDLAAVVDSTNDDQQLIHYRRVSGPKNRRRPDSTGRRERAKEAAEEAEAVPPQVDSEPDSPKPDSEPPQIVPKKEAPRGIQVMPIPGAGGGEKGGEKPAWMKNLKRPSVKVPPKPEEPAKEAPNWLANMRKKPKPVPLGDKTTSPVVPSKPGPGVTPPKPVGVSPSNRRSMTSSPGTPVRPTSPGKLDEKPVSRPSIKENEHMATLHEGEDKKPEAKKHPSRPPVSTPHTNQPADLPKKPPAAKRKPPPPSKVKPALPSAKPHPSSASADEMKEEIKALKEQLSNYQKESSKEISRLSNEIEEERNKRLELQLEVANLAKKLG